MFERMKAKRQIRKMNKVLSKTEMTPRGVYVKRYLEDLLRGEDVFIQAYEDYIATQMESSGLSRLDTIKRSFIMLSLIETGGDIEFDPELDLGFDE